MGNYGLYPNARLDEFIVMPDHLHGIIKLGYCRGAWPSAPTIPNQSIMWIAPIC